MAAERAEREPALLDRAEERLLRFRVPEQHVRVAVGAPRIVPCAELDRLDPEQGDPVEHRLERQIREQHGENAELHVPTLSRP